MENVTLVREVDGFEKEAWVDVWVDYGTGLHHPRITYEAWPRNELHFEEGHKSSKAAEKVARALVDRLRAEGWKDELSADERARVDARVARRDQEERDKERREKELLAAFPLTAVDQRLARAIASPEGVTELDLRGRDGDRLTVVPPAIKKLKALEVLHLEGNELESLPDEFGKLNALRALHLARNKLAELPRGVWYMRKLALLDVHDNRLGEIDEYFGDSQKPGLELQAAGNPLKGLPSGIFEKLATLGVDTASFFPIGDRFDEDDEPALTALHLYGRAPTDAERAELARWLPRAKIEVFPRVEDGPRVVAKLAPIGAAPPKAKNAAAPKKAAAAKKASSAKKAPAKKAPAKRKARKR